MSFLERKYILMMSNRFTNWKVKDNQFNFSCPYCGDSTKNKFKARGYMLQQKGSYFYFCHNCGISKKFDKFIEEHDRQLYFEYRMEKMKDSSNVESPQKISTPHALKSSTFPGWAKAGSPLRKLKKISQLDWNHPVKEYINLRRIPNRYHAKLFYCPKFYRWANELVPGKFKEEGKDEARLIIPFLDKRGNMFGFQGRSLSTGESTLRYITVMLDENADKLFGLDDVNTSKLVYVLEGPIDSMFVWNSVAMAGSDGTIKFDNYTMVYDNEPRNKEIIAKMKKSIKMGRKIVVWPSSVEHKDINDMIMSDMSQADVKLLLDMNTHKGLMAEMALSVWSKI
jgi:hypothetical protein